MTLRDLSDEQVKQLTKTAERYLADRQKGSHAHKPIDPVDYKLFFSDGVKAVLSFISFLP